ncbi:hypothetical protein [Haloarchaeobius iranensis]|uniref:Uncharacterized protein n=1 Tax=Haloarchaeobius iranensis TaxID=996166 RepID=A0A1G9VMI1_9EURY|nr:hypothetical protein [Haloarchaeobius iranensis]SDM73316.1 hypothetical protein SAMN05192554_106190 [Haloarchaeobius iranensis]
MSRYRIACRQRATDRENSPVPAASRRKPAADGDDGKYLPHVAVRAAGDETDHGVRDTGREEHDDNARQPVLTEAGVESVERFGCDDDLPAVRILREEPSAGHGPGLALDGFYLASSRRSSQPARSSPQ